MKRIRYIYICFFLSLICCHSGLAMHSVDLEDTESFVLEIEQDSKESNEKEESKDGNEIEFEKMFYEFFNPNVPNSISTSLFCIEALVMQFKQSIPDPPPDRI